MEQMSAYQHPAQRKAQGLTVLLSADEGGAERYLLIIRLGTASPLGND